MGARRPRVVFEGMPWALYLPRDTAYRVEAEGEVAICGARCERTPRARPRPPGGRRDRGARRRQRHAPDQPHPQAGVPGRAPARGRGLHALRQLVELPAAQARRGPAAGRGRARGDVLLPNREARGVRGPAAVQPPARARPHGDRSRRRSDARPVRLPHDRGRARLRPLLPERARGRPALDGLRRRSRPARGSARRGTASSRTRASRSSDDPRRERTGQLRRVRVDGGRECRTCRGPSQVLDAIAAAGYEGTELGPIGYFGHGDEVRSRLALARAGRSPARSSSSGSATGTSRALEATLDVLEGFDAKPVLCDRGPARRRRRSRRGRARVRAGACARLRAHVPSPHGHARAGAGRDRAAARGRRASVSCWTRGI